MRRILLTIMTALGGLYTSASAAYDCSQLDPWNAQPAYLGGAIIERNGNAYRANWWTRNHDPIAYSGQWQEWTLLEACDAGGGGNLTPSANANGPYSGTIGTAVQFSSEGSADPDGGIVSFKWTFGDGNSSASADPSHSYNSAGTYSVTLTVIDLAGASNTATTTASVSSGGSGSSCTGLPQYSAGTQYAAGDQVFNVRSSDSQSIRYVCDVAGWCSSAAAWAYGPGNGLYWNYAWNEAGACDGSSNQSPTAEANGPYAGEAGVAVNFSSTGSADPDGGITGYHWAFGDGSTSIEANPSHAYAAAGAFPVTLTVTDAAGATAADTATASIVMAPGTNLPPVAAANGPYTATLGEPVAFSSSGSADADGAIVSYSWDFGDGSSSSLADPLHQYASTGTFDVTLEVTDNEGATASATTQSVILPPSTGGGDGKVIGYFVQWGVYARNYHVKNIVTSGSADKLTHIIYAFGNVQNGECVIGDSYADYDRFYDANLSVDGQPDTWDTGALRGNFNQFRKLKALYPNIKVIWSFGGWTWSSGFGQAAANPAAFAESCYNLVHDPRWDGVFDGIDIDWEYPNSCGLQCDTSGFAAYGNLMSALRNRFGNELVTSAIGAGPAKLNAANYATAAQYVDFYMLMTYDYFGPWDAQGPTAPHSPLWNYTGIPIDDLYSDNSVQLLRSKGVPADKIMLGIGFYGKGWSGVTASTPGGSASGPAQGTYEQGTEDYHVLKTSCPPTGSIAGTAYAHCGSNWWSYDTPGSIAEKMDYVNSNGLGGTFFWELSGDTNDGELIRAISNN